MNSDEAKSIINNLISTHKFYCIQESKNNCRTRFSKNLFFEELQVMNELQEWLKRIQFIETDESGYIKDGAEFSQEYESPEDVYTEMDSGDE